MKWLQIICGILGGMIYIGRTMAAIFYVDVNCANATPPYTNWNMAATDIQSAVDASSDGDLILVNDGLYGIGGRVVYGALTNRVVINKAVTVQSVNGPGQTVIQGNPVVGDGAIRCVYLTNNASLNGFTLADGATRAGGDIRQEQSGGAIWCESRNCLILNSLAISNSAAQYGGGVYSGNYSNCTFLFNSATYGGGAALSYLTGCLINTNAARYGGGAYSNSMNNCVISGNQSTYIIAGAYGSVLNNCTISWNTNTGYYGAGLGECIAISCVINNNTGLLVAQGGGAINCALTNCYLLNNTARYAGGAFDSTLNNCTVSGNHATDTGANGGGGALASTLFNCTVSGNSAGSGGISGYGGGGAGSLFDNCLICSNSASTGSAAAGSTLNNCTIVGQTNGVAVYNSLLTNCIVYNNFSNNMGGRMYYCCSIPLPSGAGNFTNAPGFINPAAGDYRLQSNSPCINAGNNQYVPTGTDLDGNPRIVGGTVDIGCYEYQTPSSVLSYAWAQQYGLPTDGTADYADPDGDGMSNYAEWKAGTNPTNAASVLALQSPATTNTPGITVTWQSVSGVTYYLQSSTDLPAFTSIQSNLVGLAGSTSYTDTTATNGGPYFYRVGVQ